MKELVDSLNILVDALEELNEVLANVNAITLHIVEQIENPTPHDFN